MISIGCVGFLDLGVFFISKNLNGLRVVDWGDMGGK